MKAVAAISIVALFALGGCTSDQIARVQQLNDDVANASIKAPCLARVGAYFRLAPKERGAVWLLCDPSSVWPGTQQPPVPNGAPAEVGPLPE